MQKSAKKKPAKKKKAGRPAKKKARKTRTPKGATSSGYEMVPVVATNKDTEVESLAAICSIFDNWNNEQKQRNLKYLCGRYYDFL
jgi:hypothetical protein